MQAELREKPAANEGTSDSDEEVADDPEAGALHDLAREPSGNEADHQYDQAKWDLVKSCFAVGSSRPQQLTISADIVSGHLASVNLSSNRRRTMRRS